MKIEISWNDIFVALFDILKFVIVRIFFLLFFLASPLTLNLMRLSRQLLYLHTFLIFNPISIFVTGTWIFSFYRQRDILEGEFLQNSPT